MSRDAVALDDAGRERFHDQVEPILAERCFDCHGNGASEAGVALDGGEAGQPPLEEPQLWLRALKQVRAGLMPPEGDRLPAEELAALEAWIVRDAFGFDPAHPDPGRVTLRRLNRTEYRNTVRDLLGVDFNAFDEFPPDDTGHGFDNLGDVLSISPLLLEKYVDAAQTVVDKAMRAAAKQLGQPNMPAVEELIRWQAADVRAYFPTGTMSPEQRVATARPIVKHFAERAYRRPIDDVAIERLLSVAGSAWEADGQDFAAGIGRALTAVLASPRFLFRTEETLPADESEHPLVDEFALASRLSYFLWSTMPDEELFRLAAEGRLRAELPTQVERMLADERSDQFYRNFVGQWLQTRDVTSVPIDPAIVSVRDDPRFAEFDAKRNRYRALRRRRERKKETLSAEEEAEFNALLKDMIAFREKFNEHQFTYELRESMREETERHVEYVLRENRPLTELIDCNYAFLNKALAKHYGLEGLEGLPDDGVERVELPAESRRGGLLTEGSFLIATSNPDRTSPVKRGLFILENLLGTPPAPPPANVPPLEAAEESADGRPPTLREALEKHRSDPMCHSCHARMDPLGLALENFNAMGAWRDQERGQPIDAAGEMVTGESLAGAGDLKRALVAGHAREFYACFTEKLLTYAVGRGLDYNDAGTVDAIVARIVADNGRAGALAIGVVESAPFQRRRRESPGAPQASAQAPDDGARSESRLAGGRDVE